MKVPALVGSYEIQEMLGVSRQRVQQLINGPKFPRPVQELAMGKVWLKADVERWARDAGRPLAE